MKELTTMYDMAFDVIFIQFEHSRLVSGKNENMLPFTFLYQ